MEMLQMFLRDRNDLIYKQKPYGSKSIPYLNHPESSGMFSPDHQT